MMGHLYMVLNMPQKPALPFEAPISAVESAGSAWIQHANMVDVALRGGLRGGFSRTLSHKALGA